MRKTQSINIWSWKGLLLSGFLVACLGAVLSPSAPQASASYKVNALGGKLYYYNGNLLNTYYGTNYPGTGWGYYNSTPYVSGWSRMPSSDRWILYEGSWSKGAFSAPWTGWPTYHDVDAVWVPRCYWMRLDTQQAFDGTVWWQYWRWLPGGPEGRWFKLNGPLGANDGRYRISDIHYDSSACNAY